MMYVGKPAALAAVIAVTAYASAASLPLGHEGSPSVASTKYWFAVLRLCKYTVALMIASPVGVPILPSAIVCLMMPFTFAAFIGMILSRNRIGDGGRGALRAFALRKHLEAPRHRCIGRGDDRRQPSNRCVPACLPHRRYGVLDHRLGAIEDEQHVGGLAREHEVLLRAFAVGDFGLAGRALRRIETHGAASAEAQRAATARRRSGAGGRALITIVHRLFEPLPLSPEPAEQASESANDTALSMTEGFMIRPRSSFASQRRTPGLLVGEKRTSTTSSRASGSPSPRLRVEGESGRENHRTHGFPARRAGLRRGGGLCAADGVMRAPEQSIMVRRFFCAQPGNSAKNDRKFCPALALRRMPERALRYRWLICSLLFLATTVNYIDRQILSLLKPILDDELKWSNTQFGGVIAAFQGAYALGLLSFGYLVDRFGTKVGYALSIAAWSVAAIGHAAVGGVTGVHALRTRRANGLGEGGNFPSAIKAVALWFPRKERALATALFNSGTNVGAIVALRD